MGHFKNLYLKVPFDDLGSLGTLCQPWPFRYTLPTLNFKVPFTNLEHLGNLFQPLILGTFCPPEGLNHYVVFAYLASLYRLALIVSTWTHGIDMDLW